MSHATAGGTQGWRAPECIAAASTFFSSVSETDSQDNPQTESHRITKAVDIFSAGCVIHYILTGGEHPFGKKFSRESNIIKGNMQLEKLDNVPDGVLARDLIKRMVALSPSKRYVNHIKLILS